MINVGVVGTGGIFRELHLPHYLTTKRARVVAVADVNERSAKEAAQACGAKYFTTDFRELLSLRDVEAVDICTPPSSHKEIAVAAAELGKHVLVEKPMCRTLKEVDEMIAAADRAGVVLQVAYMLRFHPTYMVLKRLLDEGSLGEVHLAYSCQVGWFPTNHPWLFSRAQSGGMLVEQAIHTLDEWLWLYGPVDTVYAQVSHIPLGGTYPPPPEAVENNASVIVRFARGGTGVLIKSWAAEVPHIGEGVVCSNGSASVNRERLTWKLHAGEATTYVPDVPDDDTYRAVDPESRRRNYWSYASKGASIEHWLKCIEGEEEPETSGRVGRAGVELAEAAYRSSDSGQPVRLGRA